MFFADIILPFTLHQLYTYHIPDTLQAECVPGKRVVVQFGKKKIYTAIIKSVHQNKPENYETKDIIAILDSFPIISEKQFQFWEWIANYYMCTLGDVFKAALPAGLKLESESNIALSHDFNSDEIDHLTDKEIEVVEFLQTKKESSVKQLETVLEQKKTLSILKSLVKKGIVIIDEKIEESIKPKLETKIRLSSTIKTEQELRKIFDSLNKTPKQLHLLMSFMQFYYEKLDKTSDANIIQPVDINKQELLKRSKSTSAALNSLLKKNIFEIVKTTISRFEIQDLKNKHNKELNEAQQYSFQQIKEQFSIKDVVLLHGITSSGKTELYIKLIEEYVKQGKQVLYLLPEIALTTQIINRLKNVFGDLTGIYHSKFNDAERIEVWERIYAENQNDENKSLSKYQIILGVRSSIFLPFYNLGLIIIDEEHENTYKQFDPAPRYHARDAAIVLGHIHGAKVLLGTATPSIETYFNAEKKKYGLVELKTRYKNIQLPEILIADTKDAKRRKLMKSHFTPLLLDNINIALNNHEQIILFQNRRGYSPFMECNICGWVPKCEHCDVSLTYHKNANQLNCHYCGYTLNIYGACLACGEPAMIAKGFGTEKIEDEISIFFPEAKVARMDWDTTRTKKSYQKLITSFEQKEIDILIGTQMVSKGLDFENVSVVGILNADNLLNFPDFRAFERSYQLMAQVSGRAGRSNKRGKVIIQASEPSHSIIQQVISNNFIQMYKNELLVRRNFKYPPFYRLIEITIKHKNKSIVDDVARLFAEQLRSVLSSRVLGPEYPLVSRIQNWYLKTVLIKVEVDKSLSKVKDFIQQTILQLKASTAKNNLMIVVDVDPM